MVRIYTHLLCLLLLSGSVLYGKIPQLSISILKGKPNIVPVAVIGSGPAGLTAALYTARAHLPTVVFTGSDVGGQLTEARFVENWPSKQKESGAQLMEELQKQVGQFGAKLVEGSVSKVDFSSYPYALFLDSGEEITALSCIIATGGDQKKLSIPGVDEYWGKGIGICTICDAPFDKDKEVAIVGSSDITCDMVLQLREFAKHIYVCVPGERMEAAAVNQKYLQESKNVTILLNTDVKKINGDGKQLSGIEIADKKTGKKSQLPVQSFYFAFGFKPSTELFRGQLVRDKNEYIKVYNGTKATSKPLIFAAGTVIDPIYQKGLISASMGAQAAIDLIPRLQDAGFSDELEHSIQDQLYKKIKPESAIVPISSGKELQVQLKKNGLVLVEFYGQNCKFCKEVDPIIQELAKELKDVTIVQFNVQKEYEIIQSYKLEHKPTFILFKDGTEVGRLEGVVSKDDLRTFAQQNS